MVLRRLLQSWLENAATQHIRKNVAQAAREHVQGAVEDPRAAPSSDKPETCHVGVVFALGIEAGGLEDLLQGVITTRGHGFVIRQGGLKGRRVMLLLSGPGRENAARVTDALIAGHKPRWVVSAGFAGGLDARLQRGDIVVADRLIDTAGTQQPVDLHQVAPALTAARGVHVGRLLTADRIIRLPREKQSLGHQFGALAVDMESSAVAEVCRRHETAFLAVRVIHDTQSEKLPPDVERLLAQKTGAARLGAALGAIWNRPSSLKDLLSLKEGAIVASDRLAMFLTGLMERL